MTLGQRSRNPEFLGILSLLYTRIIFKQVFEDLDIMGSYLYPKDWSGKLRSWNTGVLRVYLAFGSQALLTCDAYGELSRGGEEAKWQPGSLVRSAWKDEEGPVHSIQGGNWRAGQSAVPSAARWVWVSGLTHHTCPIPNPFLGFRLPLLPQSSNGRESD